MPLTADWVSPGGGGGGGGKLSLLALPDLLPMPDPGGAGGGALGRGLPIVLAGVRGPDPGVPCLPGD